MPAAPAEPWYIVRQSAVHNLGVFAARDIPKGTRIIHYRGHKITKAESTRRGNAQIEDSAKTGEGAVYIFVLNKKHDIDGNVPWNDARLINHTCEPNCEAQIIRGTIWLVATKNIPEGTELGFNYGFDLETWEDHPCLCGTKNCCGYIVGREYWPKLRRLIKKRQDAIDEAKAEAAAKRAARKKKKAARGGK
jgi:SET domain-containing protein